MLCITAAAELLFVDKRRKLRKTKVEKRGFHHVRTG